MTRHPGLFERLPAIYRTRDAEPAQGGQFEAYIGLMDEVMEALDAHIVRKVLTAECDSDDALA